MSKKKNKIVFQTIKEELSNGITLLVREDHSMPTVSAVAYFMGGKGIEKPDKNGVCSLTHRLILRGAGEMGAAEIFEQLDNYGIRLTPFFGNDTSGLKLKTLSRHLDRGMELFSQIILDPKFPKKEFDKEKKILLDEIQREKDDILPYCIEKCEEMVFGEHPYGLPDNGKKETVENLTRKDLKDFYHRVYNPSRMVIAMVGDIKAEDAVEKICRHFSGLDKGKEAPLPDPVTEPIKNVREATENSDKQQVAICIGFQAPAITSEDFYTFSVLNQVLSGMGARLFIELRDKQGLAYSVNSNFQSYLNSGIFKAYILTGYKHKERARLSLLEEVDRLRTRLVSYDELVRAKRFHLGLFDIGLQSNSSVASKLAYYEIMGIGSDFIEKYSERIKLITRQKVKRAAEKYLKPQSYAIALLTPASYPKSPR